MCVFSQRICARLGMDGELYEIVAIQRPNLIVKVRIHTQKRKKYLFYSPYTKTGYRFCGVRFLLYVTGLALAASCEQSRAPALGQMLVRCRGQMQDKHLGAAVDKIEDQRKPEDFSGHRKLAA